MSLGNRTLDSISLRLGHLYTISLTHEEVACLKFQETSSPEPQSKVLGLQEEKDILQYF